MRAVRDDVGESVSGRSGRRSNADYACAQSREKRLDCLGERYMTGGDLKVNESPCKAAMRRINTLLFNGLSLEHFHVGRENHVHDRIHRLAVRRQWQGHRLHEHPRLLPFLAMPEEQWRAGRD